MQQNAFSLASKLRGDSLSVSIIPPKFGQLSFTCPHCLVLSRQYQWGYAKDLNANPRFFEGNLSGALWGVSLCEHCKDVCIWVGQARAYPDTSTAPAPNAQMPADAQSDYEEAASILTRSPRASAALLRLAIQKVCLHLGGNGKNINDDIKLLVSRGLPLQIQQALDVVRVVGNNAVHPGQLDVNDLDLAVKLFPLVNLIVEYMIELPLRTSALYESLPDGARVAIQRRDSESNSVD